MSAQEIRANRNLSSRLVRTEERSKLLGNLIARGVGLKEEEEFLRHEHSKFRCNREYRKKKEIITLAMKEKLRNDRKFEAKTRKSRNLMLGKIEGKWGKNQDHVEI